MKTQLYGALLYHQKILSEKTSKFGSITLGGTGADFEVDIPEWKKPFAVVLDGKLHLSPPMAVSTSCVDNGALHIVQSVEEYAFSEEDWAIANLAPGLDFVVCYRNPAAGGLASPLVALTEALESPVARTLVLSFALHSTLVFLASLGGDTTENVEYQGLEQRWVELLSSVDEHKDKDETPPEEPPVVEDPDNVIIDDTMKNLDRPKIDDTDAKLPSLSKVDKPVGVQAALGNSKIHDLGALFGSSAGLGGAMDFMPETADGDAFGVGSGFGTGLSGLGGMGGGGTGGYGTGIGGMGGGGGGGGGGGHAKVSGPKKSGVNKKPKLAMEAPKQGAFCKESNIRDVVKRRAGALTSCYERQLLAHPELSGKIIVFWKIGLDGKVTEASIKSSTMNNSSVESCLTSTVRRLQFDKPDGGICVVEFPFVFSAAK